MKWLVIEASDGSWDSYALDTVEAVQFDGKSTLYVFRKGLPPKGANPRQVTIADEPFVGRRSNRELRAVD